MEQTDDEMFQRSIGAMGFDCEDGRVYPTVAGLLMFGHEYDITREINDKIEIRQLVTDELSASDLACFLNVGFTNHYVILTKTKSKEERLFYIRRCATEFWKVETTKYYLSENLFKKEGTIQLTNFNKTIDNAAFKQRALQSFKDEYLLICQQL